MNLHDTICAIATAPGGAARGMLRISGPDAVAVVARIFSSVERTNIEVIRRASAISGRASITLHDRVHELPCDMFLWPTARSYTREPVAELHTIGSTPLLQALLAEVCHAGARLAEPGEFTLRAFLAGRIDLTQAEAVLGVIDARGDDELTAALVQLAGGLARPLQQLRDDLLQLLAELEAGLDFVEEDIEFISKESLLARLDQSICVLRRISQQMSARTTAAPTIQVALTGPPNAGKSSLFNALVAHCGAAANPSAIQHIPALVSPQSGTTRDYLSTTIETGGSQCELLDTAGLDRIVPPAELKEIEGQHESRQPSRPHRARSQATRVSDIEAAAQSIAAERGARAAIRVWCIDSTAFPLDSGALPAALPEAAARDIVVLTKCDLSRVTQQTLAELNRNAIVATSSHSRDGLDELCQRIRTLAKTEAVVQQGQAVASTAERCRETLRHAMSAISQARGIIEHESGDELAAAELRIALTEIGKVVGAVYTDDLLDRIFSSFCIGK